MYLQPVRFASLCRGPDRWSWADGGADNIWFRLFSSSTTTHIGKKTSRVNNARTIGKNAHAHTHPTFFEACEPKPHYRKPSTTARSRRLPYHLDLHSPGAVAPADMDLLEHPHDAPWSIPLTSLIRMCRGEAHNSPRWYANLGDDVHQIVSPLLRCK